MTTQEILDEINDIETALACAPDINMVMQADAEERLEKLQAMLRGGTNAK
jgi:hypothetical protein